MTKPHRKKLGNGRIAIFDMGNVILPFDHMQACRAVGESTNLSPETVYCSIFESGLESKFEAGELDGDSFHLACMKVLDAEMRIDEFRERWSDIFWENLGVSSIIRHLQSSSIPVVLLSNTNEWHFKHVRSRFPIIEMIDEYILSYEIGACKPSHAIFHAALQRLDSASQIVYFDDVQEYVDVASELGMIARRFSSEFALTRDLMEMGYLDDCFERPQHSR